MRGRFFAAGLMAWLVIGFPVPCIAGMGSDVDIPLDHADQRFGKFYVKSLSSLLYQPAGEKPAPSIVLLHGCGGLQGVGLNSAISEADHLASLGYATLLLDVYDDRGLGERPCHERQVAFPLLEARRADL